jgi:hypothetical protein
VPPCDVPQGYASVVPLPAALLAEILSSLQRPRKRHPTSFSSQKHPQRTPPGKRDVRTARGWAGENATPPVFFAPPASLTTCLSNRKIPVNICWCRCFIRSNRLLDSIFMRLHHDYIKWPFKLTSNPGVNPCVPLDNHLCSVVQQNDYGPINMVWIGS